MSDKIKYSVRLPKTDFSMKANFNKLEPIVLKSWEENDIYNSILKKNKSNHPFILHDGPPYANGNIHVGHALNKIVKDIIVKSYIVRGYYSPFILGWDCHGLPIEWKIEEKYKKKKIDRASIDINDFREECQSFAHSWVDKQKEQFKSLGIIADYDNSYLTTDFSAEKTIVSSILELLKQGVIYQGKKPVMWSCIEQTALAEAEVDYKDKTSNAIYVSFQVKSISNTIDDHIQDWLSSSIVIWTTTPWTLPSNQAVAYGENIDYGLYEVVDSESLEKSKKFIVAKDLANGFFTKLSTKVRLISEVKSLLGFSFYHPLSKIDGYNRYVPALRADFVDTTVGTGIVHIAPSHGEDDFYLCKKNDITPLELVKDNGVFNTSTPLFAGEHIFKVDQKIIEALANQNSLLLHEVITHSYPHSWRSKAPLIYRLTSQWFISMDKNGLREKAISALDNIDFYPKISKNRLLSMLQNRPDWTISRQRSWGVPLSIFLNKETNLPLIDDEVFSNIIDAFSKEGSKAWFNQDPKRFLTDKYHPDDYMVVNDVVDVWIDSGLSHNYVLKQRDNINFPADVYLEGSDQHRGWFQSSLIMSLLLLEEPPYKKVITHGFILDDQSQKMSKSQGNVISPENIVQEFGADILRLWVANVDFMEDVNISKNILLQQVETYRKIRNTLRYIIANLAYYETSVDYDNLGDIDKWILRNIFILDELYEKTFSETFALQNFFSKLFNFILNDLSAFYLDIKKDTLYCDSAQDKKFKSTISTLNVLFDFMLKWLSPFIPFTMEEAYSKRYSKDLGTLFLFNFPKALTIWNNNNLTNWELIKKVRKVVTGCLEKKRAEKVIGSSLEAAPIIYVNLSTKKILEEIDFSDVCITSSITIREIREIVDKKDLYSIEEIKEVFVEFQKSQGHKCERCWKFFSEISDNNLCNRCESVIFNKER